MSMVKSVKEVKVSIKFSDSIHPVGRLAIQGRQIYFEYFQEFVEGRLEISPLFLPLKTGIQSFDYNLFEGLPGVFNDSLPDGWGRLLFDRFVRSRGMLPADITPLDRLTYIGQQALGALITCYKERFMLV